MRDLGVQMSPDLKFDAHILQVTRSCTILVDSIFRCFVIRDPQVYIKLYKTVVIPKLMYCSSAWFSSVMKLRSARESVQRKFIRRLAYRCGIESKDISLPPLSQIAAANDLNALRSLGRADLIRDLFYIRHNSARSQLTVRPLAIARSDTVNNTFAWRISRAVLDGSIPRTMFEPFATESDM